MFDKLQHIFYRSFACHKYLQGRIMAARFEHGNVAYNIKPLSNGLVQWSAWPKNGAQHLALQRVASSADMVHRVVISAGAFVSKDAEDNLTCSDRSGPSVLSKMLRPMLPPTDVLTLPTSDPYILTDMQYIPTCNTYQLTTKLKGREVCMIATGLGTCQFHVVVIDVISPPKRNIVIPIGGVHLAGQNEVPCLANEVRNLENGICDYNPPSDQGYTSLFALKQMIKSAQMLCDALDISHHRIHVYAMLNNINVTPIPDHESYNFKSREGYKQLTCLLPHLSFGGIHAMCAFRPAKIHGVDPEIMKKLAKYTDNPADLLYAVRFASWNSDRYKPREDGEKLAAWYESPYFLNKQSDWEAWSMHKKDKSKYKLYVEKELELARRYTIYRTEIGEISYDRFRKQAFENLCGRPFKIMSENQYVEQLHWQRLGI